MPRAKRTSSTKKRWAPLMLHPQRDPSTASTSASLGPSPLPSASPTHLYTYSTSSGSYDPFTPTSSTSRSLSSKRLRCATWNTWASSESPHSTAQAATLLRILRGTRADVIALQEVSSAFETLLQRESWARDYALTSTRDFFAAAGEGGGGKAKEGGPEAVLLMVKRELVGVGSRVAFERLDVAPGERGKALVVLHLNGRHGDEEIRIASSHFTALPLNAVVRDRQLALALSRLTTTPARSSILLGDFNNSSEAELFLLSPFLHDAFTPPPTPTPDLFRSSPTFGSLYPFVPGAPRSKPRKPRRIDRVYIGGVANATGYEEVGREQVRDASGKRIWDKQGAEGRVWPSDHIGLVVTVDLKG